jgi:8-oxo-dGTP diphosphatase
MRERPTPLPASKRLALFAIDVVIVTPVESKLAVLCVRSDRRRAGEPWVLPWGTSRTGEPLEAAARRVARSHLGVDPAWLEQVGAFVDGRRHPSGAGLSVCFVAVAAAGTTSGAKDTVVWAENSVLPPFGGRQKAMVGAALDALRHRMDYAPIPFRLLTPLFTLSDLQRIYELLLGRRLHKASFRRALHAAWLVEPTDEWRSEGRGRPAQLFRFAPRKRRGHRRAVRFDLL